MSENLIFRNIVESDRVTPQEKVFLRMVYEAWVDPAQAWVDESVKESIYKHAPEGFDSDEMYDTCLKAADDAIKMASVLIDKSVCEAIDEYVRDCKENKEEKRRMEWEYQSSRI